jgi:hypothetical protein
MAVYSDRSVGAIGGVVGDFVFGPGEGPGCGHILFFLCVSESGGTEKQDSENGFHGDDSRGFY